MAHTQRADTGTSPGGIPPPFPDLGKGQEYYTVDFDTIREGFEEDAVVFLLNETAAGVSEVHDPIASTVADVRRRRSGLVNCNRLTGQHPLRTGDPFESGFGPLVW